MPVYEVEIGGKVYEVDASNETQAVVSARLFAARNQGTEQAVKGAEERSRPSTVERLVGAAREGGAPARYDVPRMDISHFDPATTEGKANILLGATAAIAAGVPPHIVERTAKGAVAGGTTSVGVGTATDIASGLYRGDGPIDIFIDTATKAPERFATGAVLGAIFKNFPPNAQQYILDRVPASVKKLLSPLANLPQRGVDKLKDILAKRFPNIGSGSPIPPSAAPPAPPSVPSGNANWAKAGGSKAQRGFLDGTGVTTKNDPVAKLRDEFMKAGVEPPEDLLAQLLLKIQGGN